jgi:hypothetical protein
MGAMTPKGPNPLITDSNSPLYTELSKLGARWVTTGLIGDAQVFAGRGYDQYVIDTNFQDKIDVAVGDFVLLGNRSGVVTQVTLNGGSTKVISIGVREDMKYLPEDYRSNPTAYGYTATGFDRQITYILDPSAVTAGNRVANTFLFIGTLLIMKQRKADPATWGKYANDVLLANSKGLDPLFKIGPLQPNADNITTDEGTVAQAFTGYSIVDGADNLTNGDVVWTSVTRQIPIADGEYFCSTTSTYIFIENGVVADLPV